MKRILFFLVLLYLKNSLHAQTPHTPYVYTIKADSVKITNTCDTAELIIENHTQTVPGFLYNKGRGRTEFRRVLTKVDDSTYAVGIDTLKLSTAWLQGGNRFGSTGKFGTLDNNHIDFYTNNNQQMRLTNTGNLLVGTFIDDGNKVQIDGMLSLKDRQRADIQSPRFPVLIGDESASNGSACLFCGDKTSRGPISFAVDNGKNFRKFLFQNVGQPGDNSAMYNFVYNSDSSHAFNIYNFKDGRIKLFLTAAGNLRIGPDGVDNENKLQVYGTAFIKDTLKLPNLVSQTDVTNYKPVVADASGNIYKMAAWSVPARKSVTVTANSYTVPAGIDVVFVNNSGADATITLPSGTLDREITIKNLNTTNNVILSGLDTSESNTIATHGAITVKYTGSTWVGISKY